MSQKSFKVFLGNNSVTLTEKNYRASGGEGSVYLKDGVAYKIYHDPKRMVPKTKIQELSVLKSKNILRPLDIITDASQTPIGFTMQFIPSSVYLCKLFTKTFRDQNGISNGHIDQLIKVMRTELETIHNSGVVVGDYNEMNFLTDDKYTIPYHIDVDSWQTKSFRATAIMATVRDRSVKFGTFNMLTDWFAFAIISFQLYTGLHPFKGGRHPNYKPREWEKRMDDRVSVFDKDVQLPPFISSFDFIPTNQLEWYKNVFVKGERSPSPVPGAIHSQPIKTISVQGDDKFEVKNILLTEDIIIGCYDFDSFFIHTKRMVYNDSGDVVIVSRRIHQDKKEFLAECHEDIPIIGYLSHSGTAAFYHKLDLIGSISADDAMAYNGFIYTIHNGDLIENRFELIGKMKHLTRKVCSIYQEACKVFPGVIIQDIMGKCWLAIPFKIGACINTHVKELDGKRIVDAKFCGRCCFVLSESGGKYSSHRILFNKNFSSYETTMEDSVDFCEINAVYIDNGIYIQVDNKWLRLFTDLKSSKNFPNPPIDASMPLYKNGTKVYFSVDNKLNIIKTKI